MRIKLIIDLFFLFFACLCVCAAFQLNCVLLSICLPILVSVSIRLELPCYFILFFFIASSLKFILILRHVTSTLHLEYQQNVDDSICTSRSHTTVCFAGLCEHFKIFTFLRIVLLCAHILIELCVFRINSIHLQKKVFISSIEQFSSNDFHFP